MYNETGFLQKPEGVFRFYSCRKRITLRYYFIVSSTPPATRFEASPWLLRPLFDCCSTVLRPYKSRRTVEEVPKKGRRRYEEGAMQSRVRRCFIGSYVICEFFYVK
jgi:hypothetical protein